MRTHGAGRGAARREPDAASRRAERLGERVGIKRLAVATKEAEASKDEAEEAKDAAEASLRDWQAGRGFRSSGGKCQCTAGSGAHSSPTKVFGSTRWTAPSPGTRASVSVETPVIRLTSGCS
jgi:hypothetical protein